MLERTTILQIVFIVAAILYILFSVPDLSEEQHVDMYLTVGEHIGFNADQTAVWFGTVPPGASSERLITITNEDNFGKKVHFEASGNISEWVKLPQDAAIGPNSKANFTIQANVPVGAVYGYYEGKLHIMLER